MTDYEITCSALLILTKPAVDVIFDTVFQGLGLDVDDFSAVGDILFDDIRIVL
jgi:hypothetical protein